MFLCGSLAACSDPGAGNAGFGFKLDAAQATVENGILAAFPNLRIGLAADASLATGGPETFSIGAVTTVPEPGVFGLMLVGLVGLLGFRKAALAESTKQLALLKRAIKRDRVAVLKGL